MVANGALFVSEGIVEDVIPCSRRNLVVEPNGEGAEIGGLPRVEGWTSDIPMGRRWRRGRNSSGFPMASDRDSGEDSQSFQKFFQWERNKDVSLPLFHR